MGSKFFSMAKRVFLFVLVNILVVTTLSVLLKVLGVEPYLNDQGLNYNSLLVFCSIFGFGGAFISLLISKWMAKRMMGIKVIDPSHFESPLEKQLYTSVQRLAQKAGLPNTPEVGYYQSPELNAFATGPSRSNALVAVSTGLVNGMDEGALEGVLGHEIAHIANGDMVTMTLLQGVINTFVMFFARVAAFLLSNAMSGDRDERRSAPNPWLYFAVQMVFEMVFGLLGMIVVAWFSRKREFRADNGGAKFAGREKMIHALQSLERGAGVVDDRNPSMAAFKISGRTSKFLALISTHPPIPVRIEALRRGL